VSWVIRADQPEQSSPLELFVAVSRDECRCNLFDETSECEVPELQRGMSGRAGDYRSGVYRCNKRTSIAADSQCGLA
jgi:hypothetical protein